MKSKYGPANDDTTQSHASCLPTLWPEDGGRGRDMWTGSKHHAGEMSILLDLCGRRDVSRASVAALVEWKPGVNVSLWEQGIRVSGNFLTNELYTFVLAFITHNSRPSTSIGKFEALTNLAELCRGTLSED
jgi:hypothetical protein